MNLGAIPAGLGARDTLRLEMGYPLYGHELNETTNAAESGLAKSIAQKEFIGSSIVLDKSKTEKLLRGIMLDGRRAARHGDTILSTDGKEIGHVTSGSFSPSLQGCIALGYIDVNYSSNDIQLLIKTERGELKGTTCATPFYKKSTGRDDLSKYL
jgi:aminomethyltransferase